MKLKYKKPNLQHLNVHAQMGCHSGSWASADGDRTSCKGGGGNDSSSTAGNCTAGEGDFSNCSSNGNNPNDCISGNVTRVTHCASGYHAASTCTPTGSDVGFPCLVGNRA
jgi:hypothetical protein